VRRDSERRDERARLRRGELLNAADEGAAEPLPRGTRYRRWLGKKLQPVQRDFWLSRWRAGRKYAAREKQYQEDERDVARGTPNDIEFSGEEEGAKRLTMSPLQ
jgi:hypothetical protein